IIKGYTSGKIPDYQIAAFLMAIFFKGLNYEETAYLTREMMYSGELIDLSKIKGIKVDKHSTGGVGDKTTLVLAPLVAAAGVPVAKMSGRGLGHTGGTLDKLESIKDFSIHLSKKEFITQVKKHGIAVIGQNKNMVPADKKLYALRDVTATVGNRSLIASSIMSKKLACGADAIVIDIKLGEGAFMKTIKDAKALAKMLIGIGKKMNRKVITVISAMHQPLGFAVGNALEVKEAIATLQGNGPKDLTELCLELGSQMLVLAHAAKDKKEAVKKLKKLIASGKAFEKFKEFIQIQGGDLKQIEQTDLLPSTRFSQIYKTNKNGFVKKLDALNVGLASMALGAGRATKDDKIDYGAGILLKKKIGSPVKKGETLAILYSNKKENFPKAKKLLDAAFKFSKLAPKKKELILKVI
ncbi:MAG TPA: pyrimidine-nucleoside phosphorylase, partial [Saprospiraceae bacterium]|nr:pyrimidine-nucleoside phosphorylase [Saprospiraceae bacterium]